MATTTVFVREYDCITAPAYRSPQVHAFARTLSLISGIGQRHKNRALGGGRNQVGVGSQILLICLQLFFGGVCQDDGKPYQCGDVETVRIG
jgi:hypothetical protein